LLHYGVVVPAGKSALPVPGSPASPAALNGARQ